MKCAKDTAISASAVIMAVIAIGGMMLTQNHNANANTEQNIIVINHELSEQAKIVYSIPPMQQDIADMKIDIRAIKDHLMK